jgi:Fe-S-cluster-containing dehydrogenase component
MANYAMICDIEKCCGCHSCFLACKDEYVGSAHPPFTAPQGENQQWMRVREVEYGTGSKVKVDYIPIMCQQCEEPACGRGAPEGAVCARADGIVVFDTEKAKGAKDIVKNCPYGAVFWNEEKQLPQKCTMCAHMLEAGEKTTRCVECCPTGALVFGDLDDPQSEISKLAKAKAEKLEAFMPGYATSPRVKYLSLPKPFVSGELIYGDAPGEPPAGLPIKLSCAESGEAFETVSDYMGDFEFKALNRSSVYRLTIKADGYKPVERTVRANAAINLGLIVLEREKP